MLENIIKRFTKRNNDEKRLNIFYKNLKVSQHTETMSRSLLRELYIMRKGVTFF